jgi:hypothetical protein
MPKIAYFDCFSGASGDMILAGLCDSGADPEQLRSQLATLPLEGYEIAVEKIRKQGFAASSFSVRIADGAPQPHRHLRDVLEIIDAGSLANVVKSNASSIFRRLAEAEARVHGTEIEKVHFHEVGAVDAIVDVVGACIALHELGIDEIRCSPIPVGSGTVRCQHGVMPVPAPATAELLKNVPLADCDEPGELTTPTGAAILTTLAGGFGGIERMIIENIGHGAGSRDGITRPNLLRILIGESETQQGEEADEVVILQANLDDVSAEVIAHACERLMAAGALDVTATSALMKKGRPGVIIEAMASHDKVAAVESTLFVETSTLGVRRHTCRRTKLRRDWRSVETRFGSIRIKRGLRGGRVLTTAPEFDDCKRAAEKFGASLREVLEEANRAYGMDGK